jgi:cell division protein FtsW
VYSAIAYLAESKHATAGSLVMGHAIKLGIAFLAMLIASKVDYHLLAKFSRIGMIVSWLLLIAVMLFGNEVFGAKRSLSIGGFTFQPVPFASLALLVHISVLLARKQEYIKDFKRAFLPIMFWVVITCALIGVEDFSSAAVLLCLSLLVMFVGRISVVQLGTLVLIGLMGATFLIWQSPERQSRIDQYVNQVVDINSEQFNIEEGYQAQQAHIAIAQGEIFGVGIGKSTQRDFLPAPYNDFIFAIIAEEYGLMGSIGLIIIFTIILIRGMGYIARRAPDNLGTLLAVASTSLIVLYGFVNAGVASGLLPVTGLPMPFVSYGGSNMVFAGLMIGILLNISKHSKS